MSRSRLPILIACLICIWAGGCAGYFRDRLKDASEMFECGAGYSMGVTVNARVTKLVQAGVGGYTGEWAGLREGSFATWSEERTEFGVTPFYYHEVFRKSDGLIDIHHPLLWDAGHEQFLNDLFLITDRGFFEVGLTVNTILVGIDISVELAEVADFVTGLVGIDILSDDAYGVSTDTLLKRLQSRSAWKRYAAARALRSATGLDFGYALFTVRDEHTEDQIQTRRLWKKALQQPAD